jgi:hypothetical protein
MAEYGEIIEWWLVGETGKKTKKLVRNLLLCHFSTTDVT